MVAEVNIHPTAVVDKNAYLGCGVKIGPYSVIGPNVTLGDGVEIKSHVVVEGNTKIGTGTVVWPFATLGSRPQDLKFTGEESQLIIGENNLIREYCNISLGTVAGGSKTVIGSNNLFMVYTHIAHDCLIGDHCIFANSVSLGGHIEVGNRVVFGGHVACHQFIKIGSFAMLGGGAIVVQDVPPYVMVHGNHAKPVGVNSIGLRRAKLNKQLISDIKSMYKILYKTQNSTQKSAEIIKSEIKDSSYKKTFTDFLASVSQRGLCR